METGITRERKWIAVLCTGAFVVSLFLSVLFIAQEADHDCIGQGCPICAAIQRCENAARLFGSGTPENSGEPALFFHIIIQILILCSTDLVLLTPVTRWVRMDN